MEPSRTNNRAGGRVSMSALGHKATFDGNWTQVRFPSQWRTSSITGSTSAKCQEATSDRIDRWKRPLAEAVLIFSAPRSQEKSPPWFGTRLLFDFRQIDGITLHQEPNCRANDQEGRHKNRENLKCRHGPFPCD